jgi:hypothetical protein
MSHLQLAKEQFEYASTVTNPKEKDRANRILIKDHTAACLLGAVALGHGLFTRLTARVVGAGLRIGLVGAGVALLLAPKTGSELRKDIQAKIHRESKAVSPNGSEAAR